MSLRPKKSLGQHFLRDRDVLARILAAADLAPGDRVLEIGAGDGTLTEPLAERCGLVIAVETDRRRSEDLLRRFPPGGPVEVAAADILRYDLGQLRPRGPLKCVSNLPYNIATAVLERVLAERGLFSLLVLMFQREVARRLVADAGDPAYGSLSVATRYRAEAGIVCTVPRRAFSPPPEVESAVVRLVPRTAALLAPREERALEALVRGGFSHRRKTFLNALAQAGRNLPLEAVAAAMGDQGISPRARAEEIPFATFCALARLVAGALP